MKAFGVIAEFNPFHRGHEYLIKTASALSEADVCISVMSGDFVQRGEPAFFDKWKRGEEAVRKGVDLVVELPQAFACSSAKYFARAGVKTLNLLGCEYIAFGSESGDLDGLSKMADLLHEAEHHGNLIKEKMASGISYPAAREEVVKEISPGTDTDILSNSNDILALEYLMALKDIGSTMKPIVVKREGEEHNISASKIRDELLKASDFRKKREELERNYFNLARYAILSSEDLGEAGNTENGDLLNKLKKEVINSGTLEELIEKTKSKRYAYTRVARLILSMVLGIERDILDSEISYIRPLAMNDLGGKYLKDIKKSKGLLTVDDVAKTIRYSDREDLKKLLDIDIKSGLIYSLISDGDLYADSDYVKKVEVLR